MMSELLRGNTPLSRDERRIRGVCNDYVCRWVGHNGITKIVAYDDFGQMSHVPWYAIFKNDEIIERIPAVTWGVQYEEGDHDDG